MGADQDRTCPHYFLTLGHDVSYPHQFFIEIDIIIQTHIYKVRYINALAICSDYWTREM